jgi:hypothetical protein
MLPYLLTMHKNAYLPCKGLMACKISMEYLNVEGTILCQSLSYDEAQRHNNDIARFIVDSSSDEVSFPGHFGSSQVCHCCL